MKKALEAELISLAHKILQLKSNKNTGELKVIARELYEKLSVLDFAQKHFDGPQPTIGQKDIEDILQKTNEAPLPQNNTTPPEPTVENTAKSPSKGQSSEDKTASTKAEKEPHLNETASTAREKQNHRIKAQTETEIEPEGPTQKEHVEDAGIHYDDLPQFEPVQKPKTEKPKENTPSKHQRSNPEQTSETEASTHELHAQTQSKPEPKRPEPEALKDEQKSEETPPNLFTSEEQSKTRNDPAQHQFSINDRLKKGIQIGLNDRLAFIKNLFDGSASDYNRVLSQLNTMSSYDEAEDFLLNQVKPDYDWSNKETYEKRFLQTVENRFE